MQFQQKQEDERARVREQNRQREERRKQVKADAEYEQEKRVENILEKRHMAEMSLARVMEERRRQAVVKHELTRLREEDRLGNVDRMARVQNWQQDQIRQKLMEEADRIGNIQQQKSQLLEQRRHNVLVSAFEKQRMAEMLEQMRITNKLDSSVLKIGLATPRGGTPQKSPTPPDGRPATAR